MLATINPAKVNRSRIPPLPLPLPLSCTIRSTIVLARILTTSRAGHSMPEQFFTHISERASKSATPSPRSSMVTGGVPEMVGKHAKNSTIAL